MVAARAAIPSSDRPERPPMDICLRAPCVVPPLAAVPHAPYAVMHGPEDQDDPFVPGEEPGR